VAGRTPQEALNTFVHPLQRALSTVSDGILLTSGVRNPPALHMLRLAQPTQRLHASAVLAMSFVCDYQILETGEPGGAWSVRGLGYRCELRDAEHEILAYHWHPFALGDVVFPHLHLSAGSSVANVHLTRAHLPTGLVHLEDVLRLVIDAFDVQPLRPDWEEVLRRSKAASLAVWV